MSMAAKLEELEKAIADAVSLIGRLKAEKRGAQSRRPSAVDTDAIASHTRLLTEENARLKEEKKEVRRRIKALIKEVDRIGS